MLLDIVIAIHIGAGLTAVVTGVMAMTAPKRPGRHPITGRVYLAAIAVLMTSAMAIVTARPHTAYLLFVGGGALCLAVIGLLARRVRWRGWIYHHLTAMGGSYIVMLTAFYVDNGPRLPGWDLLPPITFWFLPSLVGTPLLLWALWRRRHHAVSDPDSPA